MQPRNISGKIFGSSTAVVNESGSVWLLYSDWGLKDGHVYRYNVARGSQAQMLQLQSCLDNPPSLAATKFFGGVFWNGVMVELIQEKQFLF